MNGRAAGWRPVHAADIAAVKQISDAVHRGLPERIEILDESVRCFHTARSCSPNDGALRSAGARSSLETRRAALRWMRFVHFADGCRLPSYLT